MGDTVKGDPQGRPVWESVIMSYYALLPSP